MKKLLQILFFCLIYESMIGQINFNTEANLDYNQIPERSETLNLLYDQARFLENNGTPLEIEKNRLAIKNEWNNIDPEIAALYKPIQINLAEEELKKFIPKKSSISTHSSPTNRNWGDDLLIHEGFISGLDMVVGENGDIYVVGYYNDLIPANGASIFIYKSIDNGASFSLFDETTIPNISYEKMQVILFEPNQYLGVYVVTESELFGVYRFDLETQIINSQIISTGVSDFSVDRNFPLNTDNTRVFATFLKANGGGCTIKVHSARSTAGSFGFDWVDEILATTVCSKDIDFAYGRSGATYTTYVSVDTENSYVQINSNYNDPASWSDIEMITDGDDIEVRGPTIKATRKIIGSDEVLLFASTRTQGSTEDFNMTIFKRENAAPFVEFDSFGISNNNTSILYSDAWIRKVVDAEVIHLSYIVVEGSSSSLKTRTYDGTSLSSSSTISDDDNVFYKTAIAETTVDQSPCLVFGDKSIVDGDNIYFDSDSIVIIGIEENSIDDFQYYPNPTSEITTIKAPQTIEKVEIYTITGKKVKDFTPNLIETDINLGDLPSGTYLMTIHSNNQKSTHKIIKK